MATSVTSSTSTVSTVPTTPAVPGPSVKTVREVEALLKRAGFNPGKADGKVSPAFTSALKEFQTAWGLTANGSIDAKTLGKLRDTGKRVKEHAHKKDAYVSVGQKSGSIKTLEQRLARLGYDVGKADGIYSRETADAVKKFKADQSSLKKNAASGALSKKSRSVLFSEYKRAIHAPERARVRASKSLAALDKRTGTAAARGVAEGAKGSVVTNIQKHLKAAGFDPKHTTGKFDERTEGAVKNFQRKAGLPVTGVVDTKTWNSLKTSYILNSKAPQSLGERSSLVKKSEQYLKKLGFKTGKVDGLYSASTQKAVRAFEKKHHLKVDGEISAAEAKKLKALANKKTSVTSNMRRLAKNARSTAMSMGGYTSHGLCATGVSRAIQKTYGIKVWGNGNQIDNNLPKNKFKQVKMSLAKALKIPGMILTWEHTSTRLGSIYGHTAITLGDGHSSASDFIESNTIAGNRSRRGLKIFLPIK